MEKKNKLLITLVMILSLLVVGLGGFIVYDKVLSDDRMEDNKINNENVNDDNLSNNKVENNNEINNNINNNFQNTQENIGFIDPSEHVEIEENIKSKLIEVFKFVYDYNKSKYFGHYCVGATDKNDTINPPSGSDSMHKYNIASTEYSSFKEMMDYLKKYMTPNIIYNTENMTIDNFIEKDGKLYCPYYETNKGSIYEFKDAKIKYSRPWMNGYYVTMETTLVFGDDSMTEMFDVTFEKKNNNWVIISYSQFKYY